MSAPERVPVPRLSSRSAAVWSIGTGVAVLGLSAYLWVTQPGNRWAAAIVLVVVAVVAVGLVSVRAWVEPATGTVVRESFWCRHRRADLGSARSVALVSNRAGVLLLGIRHRRMLYLPILALTDYVERSQPPQVLRFLADQLDAHAPRARTVAMQLRGQADFMAGGGAATESPLAPLVTRGMLTAAKAGGLGGLFR
jgi:hypothetical protein